jgi:hypothetical protein
MKRFYLEIRNRKHRRTELIARIAEMLFGDYNPIGKLAVAFLKSVGQIPFASRSNLGQTLRRSMQRMGYSIRSDMG